jgi:acyl-CoA synthetase (AMP-forming)/AMP-acid ligase II
MNDAGVTSLNDVLRAHAATRPDDRAYVFIGDRGREEAVLTFAELDRRAQALARWLAAQAEPGARALLVFPPGLDFLVGFFGCLYAGVIAVPMMPPSRRDRLRDSSLSIIDDCTPKLGLTVSDYLDPIRSTLGQQSKVAAMAWVGVDTETFPSTTTTIPMARAQPQRDTIAFLQYTSGSTSTPKGVMVSHGNLLANLEMIRSAYGQGRHSTRVGWIPLYHDMGLILNALSACYAGALCVLMPPAAFMQRPLSWIAAIDRYRAEMTCAPNFAFDHCVDRYRAEELNGIDLSCWKVAVNGAEPVRVDTLDRFARIFSAHGFDANALHPNYGMAETTLMISGGKRETNPVLWRVSRDGLKKNRALPTEDSNDLQVLVGCGRMLPGERIAVVDPDTCRRQSAGWVGEVWVNGANVAQGYWRKPGPTQQIFRVRIVGEGEDGWLRTGDLGCVDEAGELYITGRIRDMMIFRGANYYPQDIERTAERSHPALRHHCGAAFTLLRDKQPLLVVIQEVKRTHRNHVDVADIKAAIRRSVVREHELHVHDVVLIRHGTIPKTTSGKIRRSLARQLYLADQLELWDGGDGCGRARAPHVTVPPGPALNAGEDDVVAV